MFLRLCSMKTIKCKNNYGEDVEISKDKFFFRPSAYGVIVGSGKLLLMTNKSDKKYWFPGGGIEVGEKLEEGLEREAMEETGLKIKVKRLLLSKENFVYYEPLDEASHCFLFFYECEAMTHNLLADDKVNDLESGKPRWYEIGNLRNGDFCDFNDDIYKLIQQFKK